MRDIGLIGVPTSAGAHWRGQEKAPEHLRAAGLVDRLRESGHDVRDYGELGEPAVFRPDKDHRHEQNAAAVVEVAQRLEKAVGHVLSDGRLPIVIGGDCTITVGVLAAIVRATPKAVLAYLDGGPDLNTPGTSPSGILDSMGLAHMLGMARGELARIGPRHPLLTPADVALLGFQPADLNAAELERIKEITGPCYSVDACRGHSAEVAEEALSTLEPLADSLVVHFDVDVIDFVDLPIADVPSFHGGLEWLEVLDCLRELASSAKLAALVVTEFNPDRDPDGQLARRFVDGLVSALTDRARGH